jgi:hypothetical protein
VEVDKNKLDEVLGRLDRLSAENAEQKKTIDMLVATADKARVQRYNDLTAAPITHTYRVRMFKGQAVLGWRSTVDEMYQDGHGVFHERQQVEITTEDGNKFELPFLESERLTKVITTHVATETRMEDGRDVTIFTLRLPDDREIKIDKTYIN